jgi:hypothetical protein
MPSYKPKIKTKKFNNICEECKTKISDIEAFIYVDGNNHSITQNSPILCIKCYKKRYGDINVKRNG